MITTFTRNNEYAKSVDGGQYITKTGAYVGTITQASTATTDNGAQYIELIFKGDEGAGCTTRLFITGKDGQETFERKILDALMVVCGAENAMAVQGTVHRRDKNAANGWSKVAGLRIPALEGKHVGLVFQRVNQEYNGKPTYQLRLRTPFDPDTRKVAKEILNGTDPKLLDERLANLKDRDEAPSQSVLQPPAGHPAAAAIDDDMPF